MNYFKQWYFLSAVLVFLLGFWLRIGNALSMPLFMDEGIHIDWTRAALEGETFVGVFNNKFLHPIYLLPFQLMGTEAPWVARVLSGLISLISLACGVALGNSIGGRRTGLIAGLLYAVIPMAVFHDRQALVDPLMTTFTGLVLIGAVRLARKPSPLPALILCVGLAGAYLAKSAALPYFGIPFVAVILLGKGWADRGKSLLWSIGASAAAYGLITWVFQMAAADGVTPAAIYQTRLDNTMLSAGIDAARLQADFEAYFEILRLYVGWPMGVMILLAVGQWLRQRQVGALLFLLIPAVAFVAIPLLAMRPAGGFVARYILATAIPIVVIAAYGLHTLIGWSMRQKAALALSALALIAAMIHALTFDFSLMYAPLTTSLPLMDRIQYQSGDPSGVGRAEAAHDLLALWQQSPDRQHHLLYESFPEQITSYLPRVVHFERIRDDDDQADRVEDWLRHGDQVYLLYQADVPDVPQLANFELEPISEHQHPSGAMVLMQITGAYGEAARDIYAEFGPDADDFPADYAAVAQRLAGSDPETIIAVYPPKSVDVLEDASGRRILPILPSEWPVTVESAAQALEAISAGDEGAPVEIILVDEVNSDPNRGMLMALQQHLFAIDEAWFGPLHHIRFVSGAAQPALEPIHAEYEGTITLNGIAILDPQIRAGAPIRIALEWQTDQQIEDSFAIFVHLVDAAGTLQGQHDGIPGLGLFPMPSWEVGKPITDRFAIPTPALLPAGVYTLRVGIYVPGTDLRLRVISADAGGADYVEIGQIEVIAAP